MNYLDLEIYFNERTVRTDNCWLWVGPIHKNTGYGIAQYKDKKVWYKIGAHVASWMVHYKTKPDLYVLHTCDIRYCVNPKHLFLGTALHNSRDMVNKNRQVKGIEIIQSKVNDSIVKEIRDKYSWRKHTFKQLSEEYDLSVSCIHDIIHRISWKHVS